MQRFVVQIILVILSFLIFAIEIHASSSNEVRADSYLSLKIPSKDIAGNQVTVFQSLGKKPVYLKLWASWCVPCNQQMPHFVKAFSEHSETVEFLSVNIDINDDKEAVDAMIKKYGMTMPTVVDAGGEIAKTFDMPGTPLHILLDNKGRLVHRGHKVDTLLERRLKMLVNQSVSSNVESKKEDSLEVISLKTSQQGTIEPVIQVSSKGVQAIYFTATWCDWYLTESRPSQSKNCIQGQHTVNGLKKEFTQIKFSAVVSRLWTTEKEVKEYANRYKATMPIQLDSQNQTFIKYGVNKLPTLIIFKDGKEIERILDFESEEGIRKLVKTQL